MANLRLFYFRCPVCGKFTEYEDPGWWMAEIRKPPQLTCCGVPSREVSADQFQAKNEWSPFRLMLWAVILIGVGIFIATYM